jgi:hypothetical protein
MLFENSALERKLDYDHHEISRDAKRTHCKNQEKEDNTKSTSFNKGALMDIPPHL